MPKAIVTGATGYIGSHVVRHLLDQGWQVGIIAQPEFGYGNVEEVKSRIELFEYDGNIHSLIHYMESADADVVMHLAAALLTDYQPEQVSTLIRSNVEFGTQVLEAMKFSRTRLFIGTGSYWQNYNSDTYNPVDLYAATKEAFEKIIQYYVDAHGFRAITLRLFDVYGEDDKRPKLWTLLRDIAGTDKTLDISAGEQFLDMVHVSDVAKAYEAAYYWLKENPNLRNEVFGVCSGEQKRLREIVPVFQQAIGKTMNVNWGARPYKEREVFHPFSKYRVLPNWHPHVGLNSGFIKFNRQMQINEELLVSICVLTYNRSEHLKRILAFLRNELSNLDNKSEVELIISDNCSTDDTPAVIEEFTTSIGNGYNIRIQRNEENLGLLGNLLSTAEISSGKYHWWWGDDDYYKEGIIRRVISECRKNPSHIFINHSAFSVQPGDNKRFSSALGVIDKSCERPIYELLLNKRGPLMFISANVYRNDLIKEVLLSDVEKNLAFPLYCSLKCMIDGESAIIEDVMIDDNYRDISWRDSTIQKRVSLYYIPYYLSLMPKLGYDKAFSKNVWKRLCSGLWHKRLRAKLDYYYKKLF